MRWNGFTVLIAVVLTGLLTAYLVNLWRAHVDGQQVSPSPTITVSQPMEKLRIESFMPAGNLSEVAPGVSDLTLARYKLTADPAGDIIVSTFIVLDNTNDEARQYDWLRFSLVGENGVRVSGGQPEYVAQGTHGQYTFELSPLTVPAGKTIELTLIGDVSVEAIDRAEHLFVLPDCGMTVRNSAGKPVKGVAQGTPSKVTIKAPPKQ